MGAHNRAEWIHGMAIQSSEPRFPGLKGAVNKEHREESYHNCCSPLLYATLLDCVLARAIAGSYCGVLLMEVLTQSVAAKRSWGAKHPLSSRLELQQVSLAFPSPRPPRLP